MLACIELYTLSTGYNTIVVLSYKVICSISWKFSCCLTWDNFYVVLLKVRHPVVEHPVVEFEASPLMCILLLFYNSICIVIFHTFFCMWYTFFMICILILFYVVFFSMNHMQRLNCWPYFWYSFLSGGSPLIFYLANMSKF